MITIGVISDTHGVLRQEAVAALQGVDHIIHAGDVGKPEILTALAAIAPLTAIRGNVDHGKWAEILPENTTVTLGGYNFYVVHDLKTLTFRPGDEGIDVVISGHSHRPSSEIEEGVLYLNPGSAGPKRFSLPITLALIDLDGAGAPAARICTLSQT